MKLTFGHMRLQSCAWILPALIAGTAVTGCTVPTTTPDAAEVAAPQESVDSGEAVATEPALEEAPQEEEPTVEEPTVEEVAEVAPEAPAADANVDWSTVFNRTDDNRIVVGNPDAPVTLVEYSDFM